MAQYVITDGCRWIMKDKHGKYVPTKIENFADIFTQKQANAIHKNSLPKALRGIFRVEKYDLVPCNVKQVTNNMLKDNTEKVLLADNIQKWLDKVRGLNGLSKEIAENRSFLSKKLKDLEDEQLDILHYIEFTNLNAVQGWKASNDLKICRMKRRSVKNELFVLDAICENIINLSTVDKIASELSVMDNRTYTPRIRDDLFDL